MGDFSIAELAQFLDDVRPTRLTVFALGHDGLAQFPSNIAKVAPGLQHDLPEIWRSLARDRKIEFALYVSTLRNDVLVRERTDWARIRPDGIPTGRIEPSSPYVQEWLKPFLTELIGRYDPDGFFFDGDYWAIGEAGGQLRTAAAARLLGVEGAIEDASIVDQRRATVASYSEYILALASFLDEQAKDLRCSVNLAFTFRHPTPPPKGLSLITSDLPPFFGPLDAWIETAVVLDEGQEREVVMPLFVEPEGGGRKYPKAPNQLIHEAAPLLAADESVHVYFPMALTGRIDTSYTASLNEMRAEIERMQLSATMKAPTFEPDVLCLADSEALQQSQDFGRLRGAMLSASIAGLNVGTAATARCEARLDRIRTLIVPDGRPLSSAGQAVIEKALELGVSVVGHDDPDFAERMVRANWHVDQQLVDDLRNVYGASVIVTQWSEIEIERHWSVFVRGLVGQDGGWRLFFWNSVERGEQLGRHVLNKGSGYAGHVRVQLPETMRLDRVWGYADQSVATAQSIEFELTGPFAVVEGSCTTAPAGSAPKKPQFLSKSWRMPPMFSFGRRLLKQFGLNTPKHSK